MRGRPLRRASAALTVALTTLALAAGCTVGPSSRPPLATYGQQPTVAAAPSSSARPIGPGGTGRQAEPLSWGSCPSDLASQSADGTAFTVDCADLTVPKSYPDKAGQSLQLTVARARGAKTAKDAPDLVVVRGDPGVDGTAQIAELSASMPAAVLAGHAIVTLDLRGTLPSTPRMDCLHPDTLQSLLAPSVDPTAAGQADAIGRTSTALTYDCGDEVGTDISTFGTVNAADDLDSLRSALGEDRLQFAGQGFGATLGAVYADRYPGRVSRSVLDSPGDPQASSTDTALARAVALEASLTDFADDCIARGCPLGADPAKEITDLIDTLGDDGRAADRMLVTGGTVLLALTEFLGSPDRWPDLATALASATGAGDLTGLLDLLSGRYGLDEDRHLLETRIAYTCNDSAQRLSDGQLPSAAAAAKKKAPTFGAFLIGQVGLCADWPTAVQPLGRIGGAGAPAILVAGSNGDPVTPYSGVQSVVSQLSSAELITWQSDAHGAFPASSCVSSVVQAYLATGAVPDQGRLCPP